MLGIATNFSLIRPIKTKQKAIVKIAWISKKLKYINNLLIVKKAQAIALKDKWPIKKRNLPLNIKARIKKVADAEKKLAKKQTKA